MEKIEEQRHFLALLRRPGDYVFIDTSKLDIAYGNYYLFLQDIDAFTLRFTKDEIMASIRRANIADESYINGKLVIQDNQKHNPLPVIDKSFYNDFNIEEYLKSKIRDKNKLNTIINKFASIINDDVSNKDFKDYLKNGNVDIAMNILFNSPYLLQRKFIVYLVEEYNKEKEIDKEVELIRDKAA